MSRDVGDESGEAGRRGRWQASLIAAALLGALALLVLIGWQFGLERVKRIMPTWVAMNPTTAISFLAMSVVLSLSAAAEKLPKWTVMAGRALAGVVVGFGLVRIMAIVGGPDLHLDQHLYNLQEGAEAIADQATRVNRVAPNTAILMVLLGVALVICRIPRRGALGAAKMLAIVSCFISLVAMVGYVNGVSALYQPTVLTPMALHTAAGFLMLAGGIMGLRPLASARAVRGEADARAQDLLTIRRQVTAGFGVALFLLALIGVVADASMQAFVGAAAATARARDVAAAITDVSDALVQAQTNSRAFLMTTDESFRAAYRAAAAAIPTRVRTLRELVSDNPGQVQRLKQASDAITKELDDLVSEVEAPGALANGPPATAPSEREKEISLILSDMRTSESTLEAQRAREDARGYHVTTLVITAGIAIAFGLVGVAGWVIRRDLAEKERVAEELRIARQTADAANAAKGAFLANMSHEIRTPMAAIIGYADLVLDPNQSASDRLEYVNTIRRNGEHLLSIINDILDLSKIDAGRLEVERTEVSPAQVLSDVTSLMRVRASEKQLKLDVTNEGPIPSAIKSDASRLRQILINLLGNAIKFTEQGGVRLIVKLDNTAKHPRLRFDVIDSGIGLTEEQIGRLFQPFVQADTSTTRRFGGTGLGLTICKRLAEMLGGKIEVHSAMGRGSTFSLLIDPGPLEGVRLMDDCKEAVAGGDRPLAAMEGTLANARILLVDDGEDNRRLLTVYLSQAGAVVTQAENGRIAVDKAMAAWAEGAPFDVVLMDMQMPVMDGYGATALLRTKGYPLPIVALTANAMAEDADKCLSVGCTDYLSKPVRRERLLLTVARHLDAAEGADAAAPREPGVAADGVIRSELEDPNIQPLVKHYLAGIPQRMVDIQAALARNDLAYLALEMHNLKGTGGLFGLMPITLHAEQVERLLKRNAPTGEIGAQLGAMIDMLNRVEGMAPVRKVVPV